jgi:RNA polymerase sigma-70 factor (ECF subfamily)
MSSSSKDKAPANVTDEELVNLSIEDKENFYYLIKRYEKQLLRFIRRMTDMAPQELEDILQEIFIKVYCNLLDFNQNLKFSNWIYRIARNETINFYYKNKFQLRKMKVNLANDDLTALSRLMIDENTPDHELLKQEMLTKVQRLLNHLPVKFREVIILRYLEDKKYEEISDILRKPPGTVATLINRAITKLKKLAKDNKVLVRND